MWWMVGEMLLWLVGAIAVLAGVFLVAVGIGCWGMREYADPVGDDEMDEDAS